MTDGARSPEDLEMLLEDALVVRNVSGLECLFEDGARLVVGNGKPATGSQAIVALAMDRWPPESSYVADPSCVVQSRDLALAVMPGGVNVMRRALDGTWRFAIVWTDERKT